VAKMDEILFYKFISTKVDYVTVGISMKSCSRMTAYKLHRSKFKYVSL